MVKQADTRDLKSRASQEACRFKSGLQHHSPASVLLRSDDHGFGAGQVLALLQNNVSEEFLESHIAESAAHVAGPREVILSEYLIGEAER